MSGERVTDRTGTTRVATLTIEGLPPGLLARLARNAATNGRSVNSEAIISLVRHLGAGSAGAGNRGRAGGVRGPAPGYHGLGEGQPGRHVSWGEP